MSDGIIALIVVGSIVGYSVLVGVSYAFFVEAWPPDYMDVWHVPAAAFWPIALPALISTHLARRAIGNRRIPRAEVRK